MTPRQWGSPVLSVAELIAELSKIEDKEQAVFIYEGAVLEVVQEIDCVKLLTDYGGTPRTL